MTVSRTLIIRAENLKSETTLLLTFDKPSEGQLLKDQKQIAWRVVTLQAGTNAKATVTWTSQPAFSSPQINDKNLVSSENWEPINLGQKCEIKMVEGKPVVQKPADDANIEKLMKCNNSTGGMTNIAVGFIVSGDFQPAIGWHGVGDGLAVAVDLTPNLSIYQSSDYKETQLIRGEIESKEMWKANLVSLDSETTLNYRVDAGTGKPSISQ